MKKTIIILSALLTLSTPIRAQVVTIDPTAIAQIIKQFQQLQQQYSLLQETYQNAIEQLNALKGTTDLGDFLNSDAWKKYRNYAPAELSDLIAAIESGSTDGLAKAAGEIAEKYGYLGSEEYYDDEYISDNVKQSYTDRSNVVYASDVIADAAYKTASDRANSIDEMRDKINGADTVKKQMDVLAAIFQEQAQITNETNKLLAVLVKNTANQQKASLERDVVDRSYTEYDSNISLDGTSAPSNRNSYTYP